MEEEFKALDLDLDIKILVLDMAEHELERPKKCSILCGKYLKRRFIIIAKYRQYPNLKTIGERN